MDTMRIAIVTLLLLPAIVTAAVLWPAVREAERELAQFEGFEGIHFEPA